MPLHNSYKSNLEEAQKFEDYVERKLYFAGLPIGVHRSRHFQVQYGESRAGVEIKYDRKYQVTGNLFIETAERHHENANMKGAGICGKGWLLAIGDYHRFWVFGMRTLLHLSARYEKRTTATAEGFLLPVNDADKYAEQKFTESPQKEQV